MTGITTKYNKHLMSLLIVLFSFLCCAAGNLYAADEPNTIFIPPKINSPADLAQLTQLTDQHLQSILEPKGLALINRQDLSGKLNYSNWPPSLDTLKQFAATPSINYVVTGSVTELGQQLSMDFMIYDLFSNEAPKYFYQTSKNKAVLAEGLAKIVNNVLSHTGKYFLIQSINITGNTRTDSGAILRQVKSQPGDRFSPDQLRGDLKNIFQMGYFEDVQITVVDSDKGKEVTFAVTEKAIIGQVNIEGESELEEKEIKEIISVSPNTVINPKEVQTSVENIRRLYKEKGFYRTTVSAKLNYNQKDRVNVNFVITEGFKVYIKEIRFVGNKAFTDKELQKEMTTSEKGILSWFNDSGKLKRDILEQDRSRIGALYHNNGYIEAKISEAEITYEDKWLVVTFDISEGDRFRVGTVDLAGDLIDDKNDLFKFIELSKEKFFSRKILRDDIMRLTDHYAEKGYAFAEANPRLQKNIADHRMDVVIDCKKGNLIHVNRIVIKGNNRTRDKIIRRSMQVKEGGILDATAIRRSSEYLQRLDFFEEVSVTPEPTIQEDLMDVIVEVKEKATGTFSVGAGYSSVDSMMFMGEISENNLLGKGQRLSLQANLSSSSNRYNLNFTEPRLNDTKLLFGYDLYNWQREYDDYTKDSTGGALRFGYPIWNKWRLGWSYGYDDTKLTDLSATAAQDILDSLSIETSSFITVALSKDTRDRYTDTSKGAVHSFSVKHAGMFLGGDSSFTKIEASTSWYFPFRWDTVFHAKGAFGYAMENETNKLPVYEKFYLGGLNTVRGFENGKISPKDPVTGERIGGEKMWYGNLEWLFPIVKDAGLKGLVFFDAGNTYEDSDSWDVSDLRYSVGFGFRWLSPMGPLRLEWGYNLDPETDEDQGIWDFSLGGSF